MGAAGFLWYQAGTDVQQAFSDAREQAEVEDGGRRGNVAAKDDAVVVHAQPVPLEKAHRLAKRYRDRNVKDTDSKWGPAGAIAVCGQDRYLTVTVTAAPGGHATLEEAAQYSLAKQGLLRQGEAVVYGVTGMCTRDGRGRIISGTLDVPLEGGVDGSQTGWLFFGTAAE